MRNEKGRGEGRECFFVELAVSALFRTGGESEVPV